MWHIAGLVSLTLISQFGGLQVVAVCDTEPVAFYPLDGEHLDREIQNRTSPADGDAFLAPGRFGNPDGSYQFDGVAYLDVDDNNASEVLDVQYSITLLLWAYPDPFPYNNFEDLLGYYGYAYECACDNNGADDYGVAIFFDERQYVSWRVSSRNGSQIFHVNATVPLPVSTWTHVGASYNNATGEARVFFNGSVVETRTLPTNIELETQNRYFEIGFNFTGRITQVRVYDVALNESQVYAVYTDFECPTATVDCGYNGTFINITIYDISDLPEWIGLEDEWKLNGGVADTCRPSFSGNTATYGPLVGDECASPTLSTDYIIYTFQITAEVAGNSPTRRYDHNYLITCNYSRHGSVTALFQPLQELQSNAIETTAFMFSLNLYRDESRTQLITSTVYLDEFIYVRVKVIHDFGEDIDILLENCYTSSDEGGLNDEYSLIRNSCDTGNDFTVSYTCNSQTSDTEDFSFRAFRYAGGESDGQRSNVWLHCRLYACLSDNSSSVCQALCDAGCGFRKRRDTDQVADGVNEHEVSAGPFQVVEREQEEQDTTQRKANQQAAKLPTKLIIIFSVCSSVALAIICVTTFIVKRSRRGKSSATEIPAMGHKNPICVAGNFNRNI